MKESTNKFEFSGCENTNNKATRFLDELISMFRYELEQDFVVIRSDVSTLAVRYPLTNTFFVIRLEMNFHNTCWHIIDGNCDDLVECTKEFDLDECVSYIRLHKFGHSMPAYFSYAV